MTKPLTKEDLIRSAWITELRRQGERQCVDWNTGNDSNRVCALQLLWELVRTPEQIEPLYADLGALAGLSERRTWDVIDMNDGQALFPKSTFSEIADVVESWFKI